MQETLQSLRPQLTLSAYEGGTDLARQLPDRSPVPHGTPTPGREVCFYWSDRHLVCEVQSTSSFRLDCLTSTGESETGLNTAAQAAAWLTARGLVTH